LMLWSLEVEIYVYTILLVRDNVRCANIIVFLKERISLTCANET
jgi:hypothetical protein